MTGSRNCTLQFDKKNHVTLNLQNLKEYKIVLLTPPTEYANSNFKEEKSVEI